MTWRQFIRRSLTHHRGIHIAVALGVAVGTAVLSGALLVGDSVRGSLRDLTLDRLGEIDHALVGERYVREALAAELVAGDASDFRKAAPAVLIRGNIQGADSGARANSVNIHGVDERFWSFFGETVPELSRRDVLLNRTLAGELGVEAGAAVLLRFAADTLVPAEAVMGRKDDNVRTLRLQVAAVLEDRGPGRFGLSPSQQLPQNVFLPLETLQEALERDGRANAVFVSGNPTEEGGERLNALLDERLKLEDIELSLRPVEGKSVAVLDTSRIVLEQSSAQAAEAAADSAGLRAIVVLTYLANRIRAENGRSIPYSTVTAMAVSEPPFEPLTMTDGSPAPALSGDEILLDEWSARDLEARAGESVELTYYLAGEDGRLLTESHAFRLRGIVRMSGPAVDHSLAPEYKGMSDADRMGDWDPPFPVDLSLIRPIDEDYWERYRAAPKAFVGLDTAKQLWTSRFGQLTSLRLASPEGARPEQWLADYEEQLRAELRAEAHGLQFQPVKARGLAASQGATDFSGLFIGFSLFLIVSAAMLVSLLFRLGVERRSREVGLLLAVGQPAPVVRRLLLLEGSVVATAGCLLGLPLAAGYGALMVHGLKTWWKEAVGGSFLELYIDPVSLAAGAVGALVLMVLSIWLSLRRLERLSPRAMLAGQVEEDESRRPGSRLARRPRMAAALSAGLAAALLVASLATEAVPQAAGFFAVAALLLTAALAAFRARLLRPAANVIHPETPSPLWRLGARNGARYPTRSVLSAGLVASATFLIVTVSVNRHDVRSQEPRRESGDGGFRFVAESDLAVFPNQFEFPGNAEMPDMTVFPLRVSKGEDASCLNLYRPSRPTLLGAPEDFIARDGFAFQSTLAETPEERENPWLLLKKKFPDGSIPVFGDANSVMWILHLGLGDRLTITDENGRERTLRIAGMLSRSIFQSELILSEENFLDMMPSHSGFHMFLIETGVEEAAAALEERFADRGFDAQGTAERLAGYLVVENTYLSTFQTLGGLGLLLGTLGLAVVMVRNVVERRGEISLLRAVGFGDGAIRRIVLAENGFVLVFGMATGTVCALLAVLPHLLSGLAEPPWGSLALTLAAILVVGMGAGTFAVRASLRWPLIEGLRRE